MLKTINDIGYLEHLALVTVNNIPNKPESLAAIMNEIAARHVTIDMIGQTAPYKDKITLSLTLPQDSLSEMIGATGAFKAISPEISTNVNGNNTKVILMGAEMRNIYGVAAELFQLLSDANISIKLITTAEAEISFLIDIKDTEKVKELLKS